MKIELRPIDRQFADFICRESGVNNRDLWSAAAMAGNAVGQGHICLDLAEIADKEFLIDDEPSVSASAERLISALRESSAVGKPGEFRPLVLDDSGRLYLHRYWKYESDLATVILDKASSTEPVSEDVLKEGLARLFPATAEEGSDWQAVAAIAAVRKRFCIISGGPGTGKTSTVVKILALLLEQQPERRLKIALAAPTGKAAARLNESISRMKDKLLCTDEIRGRIPSAVSTIHRLLGTVSGSVRFRYSADNPLPHDIVIIDEASMVDLPLMAKLVTALKSDARLILLGDREQLASVEAGAVLGDLCGGDRHESFSPGFSELVHRLTGVAMLDADADEAGALTDTLVMLKKNYRFRSDSGIGVLASAINGGNGVEALSLLQGGELSGIAWCDVPEPASLKKTLSEEIIDGYRNYLTTRTVEEALSRFDSFRVLCALREGAYGVASVSSLVEEILAEKGLIDPRSRWYRGRPVIITVNDYSLKLFNGDVGIIFPDPENSGQPRAFFPTADGGIRKVAPVRLPAHETVFAMTVHKSQGSEFGRVLMLLPDRDAAVLSRELLYTGITRAMNSIKVCGNKEIFAEACRRKIRRASGLCDALYP